MHVSRWLRSAAESRANRGPPRDSRCPGRWTVRGYNNDSPGTTWVDDANLHGVVYATFYLNGRSFDPRTYETLAEGRGDGPVSPAPEPKSGFPSPGEGP